MRIQLEAVIIAFLVCAGTASAQAVSIGVKGGLSLTEHTDLNTDRSRKYVVGPSIEFRLPANFAAEVSALYMRVGTDATYNIPATGTNGQTLPNTYSFRQRGNSWEFPLLGKYYLARRQNKMRPFLGTGYSFRKTWFHENVQSMLSSAPLPFLAAASYDSRSPLQIGATFAAGVKLKASNRIAITPELRYTRWGQNYTSPRKNDLKFLLGISF